MHGLYPVHVWILFHMRFASLGQPGPFGLGMYQIYGGHEYIRMKNGSNMRTHLLGELCENAYDFPSLFRFQFTYSVVGLNHLCRFYENGLSRSRLIVHDSLDFSLQALCHGYDEPPVSYGRGHVLLDQALALCRPQNAIQGF